LPDAIHNLPHKTNRTFFDFMNVKFFGIWLSLLLLTAVAFSQGSSPATSNYKELPNFHQVNEKVYRGAQPKKDGFKRLAQLGIKTIINLRNDDAMAEREGVEVRALGLHYFNLPLNRTGRPADDQVERALKILNNADNQPVFVHCKLGADRTGTIIAVYRISHDGWTSERAKAEANSFGMHFWEAGMKDYIHDYYERLHKSKR
jgi:tyrosine-protein phosphatase SIW14